MRIISGNARGKKLATFTGKDIRPTPDRVREAIFSMLSSRLESFSGLSVLDLFSGTGAMGLEALSRGASHAILVDQGTQSIRIIPSNIKACRLEDKAQFISSDTFKALPRIKRQGPFDLIFLDPPYGRDLAVRAIEMISDMDLLAHEGVLCAETDREDSIPERIGQYMRTDLRNYGRTSLHIFLRFTETTNS